MLFKGRGAALWGGTFFLCLYLAAVAATIGLLEASVSNFMDLAKIKRSRATWLVGLSVLLLAVFPALSSTFFKKIQFNGMGLLAIIDGILITIILPIIGFGLSLLVGWKIENAVLKQHFVSVDKQASVKLFDNWKTMLKWIAPSIIALSLLIELVGFFLSN